MKLKCVHTLLLGLLLVGGCYHEDDIIPTEGNELSFVLPQGKHDYDEDIVGYHEKYGFIPVYVFSERDLFWNNTGWVGANLHFLEKGAGTLLGKAGDPDYVGKQWKLCKDIFFECYPDSLLNLLPLKFFLCSELNTRKKISTTDDYDENGWPINNYDTTRVLACKGFDYLATNFGGPAIDTISDLTKLRLSGELNAIFLQYLHEKGLFSMPEEFDEVSNYTFRWLSGETCYHNGFLNGSILVYTDKTGEQAKANDFKSYLALVTIPLEILEGEPVPISNTYIYSLEGALNPQRDKNGLIWKKYQILIKYFKEECGINTDLWQHPNIK